MSTVNNVNVKKHRAKNTEEGLARMEVTLGCGLITQARDLATQRRCPLWQVVQEALIFYVATGNAAQTGNGK